MSKVLITGAGGFVGSFLSRLLLDKGFEVFPVVRNKESCLDFVEMRNHRFISDIHGNTDWLDALNGIDVVINLAARAHVMNEQSINPLEEYRIVNVLGLENLANQAAISGVKQLIQLSSIKVNGEETFDLPYTHESKASPEDPYGVSKLEGEERLKLVGNKTDMKVTIIRSPLIYGPNSKGNIELLARFIQRDYPLPFGLANNRRSMVSLYNLCDCIQVCILNAKAYNEMFLVSDGESISTADLSRYLSLGLGKTTHLLPVPLIFLRFLLWILGKGSMSRRLFSNLEVDSSATESKLDWTPPVSVQEAFRKMFEK